VPRIGAERFASQLALLRALHPAALIAVFGLVACIG
jgi:hypothetical protein